MKRLSGSPSRLPKKARWQSLAPIYGGERSGKAVCTGLRSRSFGTRENIPIAGFHPDPPVTLISRYISSLLGHHV